MTKGKTRYEELNEEAAELRRLMQEEMEPKEVERLDGLLKAKLAEVRAELKRV
jgi:ribosome-interacting GTPase 1